MYPQPPKKKFTYSLVIIYGLAGILAVVSIWTLVTRTRLITDLFGDTTDLFLSPQPMLFPFNPSIIFVFPLIILGLVLLLGISSYLTTQQMKKEMTIARLKSDFAQTVSHELKTPLTSIRLLAERLMHLPEKQQKERNEYYNLILQQSYRLTHLIYNILDYSKLEEKAQIINCKPTNLYEALKQTIAEYPVTLTKPGCSIQMKGTAGNKTYSIDKEALQRAFVNLLDNAIKFSPPDGTITIEVTDNSDTVTIKVIDQGPGFTPEQQIRIFERFYHTEGGTGLGLTLVKYIVEAHGGTISVENNTHIA